MATGALAVGFTKAGKIEDGAAEDYSKWIGEGLHGDMHYLERHLPLRNHTDSVLPGAKTVVSLAFGYKPEEWRSDNLPYVSFYAYGDDYHIVLKEILNPVVENLKKEYGGKWRICIDSAPIAERYWAMKSGIGKRGLNGNIIIENYGPFCFLVQILTTLEITPDIPSHKSCGDCGLCIDVCPSKSIKGNGMIDAKKCINYLTIEKKEEFTEEEARLLNSDNGYLFGCDRCLRICPHNNPANNSLIKEFSLSDEIRNLTPERILSIEEKEFKQIFSRSPLLYAGYKRLRRNALILKNK